MTPNYDMKIHSNPDAQAWAKFFIQTKEKASWQIEDIDEPLMLGWFANAMMAMHDSQRTEQEPVAWKWRVKNFCDWPDWSMSLKRPADSGHAQYPRTEGYEDIPLYTRPPQRTWVGLTLEQYVAINSSCVTVDEAIGFTERQLKENNND